MYHFDDRLSVDFGDLAIRFVSCFEVRRRTQLRWSKAALGHEARTVMSRHHSDDGGGFVTTVFVHQVDVTEAGYDAVDCCIRREHRSRARIPIRGPRGKWIL